MIRTSSENAMGLNVARAAAPITAPGSTVRRVEVSSIFHEIFGAISIIAAADFL
jgi:hypothetical protein